MPHIEKIDDDNEFDVEGHGSAGVAWAGTAGFVALLLFIGTLVYLAHNHWHF